MEPMFNVNDWRMLIYKFCNTHAKYIYLYGSMDDFIAEMFLKVHLKSFKYTKERGEISTYIIEVLESSCRTKCRDFYAQKRAKESQNISLDLLMRDDEENGSGNKFEPVPEYNVEEENFIGWAKNWLKENAPQMVIDRINGMQIKDITEKYKVSKREFEVKYRRTIEKLKRIVNN